MSRTILFTPLQFRGMVTELKSVYFTVSLKEQNSSRSFCPEQANTPLTGWSGSKKKKVTVEFVVGNSSLR